MMYYNILETQEAIADVKNLAAYMIYYLKNGKAAGDFMKKYNKQLSILQITPLGYGGINLEYHGYEIRRKSFSPYNIFYIVDTRAHQIIILRVLKDRQNWHHFINSNDDFTY